MRPWILALVAFSLAPLTAHAEETLKAVDLDARLTKAEAAFGKGDTVQVLAACVALPEDIGRLGEPLSIQQAARIHVFMAICGFTRQKARPEATDQDVRDAVAPFVRAARAVDPQTGLPTAADSPAAADLARYFVAATPRPDPGATLPDVGWGRVVVDGTPTRVLPDNTPTIVQRECGEGPFGPSRYVQAGAPAPDLVRCPPRPESVHRRHVALGVGTGVAALATFGALMEAATTENKIALGTAPADELIRAYDLNHAAVLGQKVGAALTVGLGATLWLTW